ncbi:hypothetical protein yaldo0001_31410 [Yersinia aldovae ATCC 35236]|nr:hypothetical protein yaldo0001_31410 [Yersinia aldovae ATCC 35236]
MCAGCHDQPNILIYNNSLGSLHCHLPAIRIILGITKIQLITLCFIDSFYWR